VYRCQHGKKHLTFPRISLGTINAMELTSKHAVMHVAGSPGFLFDPLEVQEIVELFTVRALKHF
jgi:hypothetical protein